MTALTIHTSNYFDTVTSIGVDKLPRALRSSHEFLVKQTDHGKDWSKFDTDVPFTRLTKIIFKKLEEYMTKKQTGLSGNNKKLSITSHLTPRKVAMDLIKPYILSGNTIELHPSFGLSLKTEDAHAHIEKDKVVITMLYGTSVHQSFAIKDLSVQILRDHFNTNHESLPMPREKRERKTYQHKQPEFKVLKAILNWHNHTVLKRQVESFINELQGYISTKQITKKSIVASAIILVQEKLVSAYNTMGENTRIVLSPQTKKTFQDALKKVTAPEKPASKKPNSLDGLLNVKPLTEAPAITPNITSSVDYANLQFKTIGFKDKWIDFIGDPSPGFTAMVFGMPKMGKSYLCVDFASYLSKNHGKVLYVSQEEFMSPTFSLKLKEKNAYHANLDITGTVPDDLSAYDFIFLDSVTSLKLTPDDLKKLQRQYPSKSFIYIFQATKGGKARGTNEFMHNVDVVIEVPEKGKAVQFGRFNQGGELNIFSNQETVP